MGLLVNVYRTGWSDCSLGGISEKAEMLCLVNVDGPSEPDDRHPAAMLSTNSVGNPIIVPARKDFGCPWVKQPGQFMNGGNLAATSDSRFGEAVRKLSPGFYGALYIHDRQEF